MNCQKKLQLVIDEVRDFSCDPGELILLGPWCLRKNQKILFEEQYYQPASFSSKEEMKIIARYLAELSLSMAKELGGVLQKDLGSNFSDRFWEQLLAPFLYDWLPIAYELVLRIRSLASSHSNLELKISLSSNMDSWDDQDFLSKLLSLGDEYRSFCVDLIEFFSPEGWSLEIDRSQLKSGLDKATLEGIQARFKSYKKRLKFSGLMGKLLGSRIERDFLGGYGLSWSQLFDYIRYQLVGRHFDPPEPSSFEGIFSNYGLHSTQMSEFQDKEFENYLSKFARQYLPELYSNSKLLKDWLEKTEKLIERSGLQEKILISDQFRYNHPRHLTIALCREKGTKVVCFQHGAYYGMLDFNYFAMISEYKASDLFLSWGWSKYSPIGFEVKARPFDAPSLQRGLLGDWSAENKGSIMVSDTYRLFPTRYQSAPVLPEQQKLELNSKAEFLHHLDSSILEELCYRAGRSEEVGIDDYRYLKGSFPKLNRHQGDLKTEISRFRLLIMDYPGTTMHFAFARNFPVLLFWNPETRLFDPECEAELKKLRNVGILHDNGIDAANWLNIHYHRIGDWWYSTDVQSVKESFCSKYARSSPSWYKEFYSLEQSFIKTLSNNRKRN